MKDDSTSKPKKDSLSLPEAVEPKATQRKGEPAVFAFLISPAEVNQSLDTFEGAAIEARARAEGEAADRVDAWLEAGAIEPAQRAIAERSLTSIGVVGTPAEKARDRAVLRALLAAAEPKVIERQQQQTRAVEAANELWPLAQRSGASGAVAWRELRNRLVAADPAFDRLVFGDAKKGFVSASALAPKPKGRRSERTRLPLLARWAAAVGAWGFADSKGAATALSAAVKAVGDIPRAR